MSGEEKKKSFSAEDRGRALTFPLATLLTIQLPNDPARLLKASSQRPSSQARFSTKFIVLSLLGLGLGLLTSTVKGAPQNGTLHLPFNLFFFFFFGYYIFDLCITSTMTKTTYFRPILELLFNTYININVFIYL